MKMQTIELFEELNESELAKLLQISSLKTYSQGNFLFFEGEKPKVLHLLLDGIVKVYKVDAKGNEIILHHFQPQTLIAETAHMQGIKYPATAICETDVEILEIEYKLFEKEFLRNPDISFKIIYSLSKKVKTLQNVITATLTMDTFSRICQFLYENEAHLSEIPNKKIATILHTTPETLSRHLATLKQKKIIKVEKRKIQLLEKERLHEYY